MSDTVSRRIPGTNRLETWDLEAIREAAGTISIATRRVDHFPEVADPECWLHHIPNMMHPLVRPEWEEMWSDRSRDPLILHPSGWVMDGYHRLGKSILEGVLCVYVRVFTLESLPNPLL